MSWGKVKAVNRKNDPLYITWKNMRQRCNNPKYPQYSDYGGRGIKVCKEWDDFKIFARDMGDRPEGLSLDRKDNEKGYSKNNCRWTDRVTQRNNSRGIVHLITFDGKTQRLSEWAKETGLHYDCLRGRLDTGWSIEKALTTPFVGRSHKVVVDGIEYKSLREAERETGIDRKMLAKR